MVCYFLSLPFSGTILQYWDWKLTQIRKTFLYGFDTFQKIIHLLGGTFFFVSLPRSAKICNVEKFIIWSETSLWALLSVYRLVGWLVGWMVCLFLKLNNSFFLFFNDMTQKFVNYRKVFYGIDISRHFLLKFLIPLFQ